MTRLMLHVLNVELRVFWMVLPAALVAIAAVEGLLSAGGAR